MKKGFFVFFITTICLAVGILFFLIQRQWLIIQWSFDTSNHEIAFFKKETVLKKEVSFFWWKDNKFNREKASLIWREGKNAENLRQVINQWLTYLKGEKILEPSITVDSVALGSHEQEAFVSFNQPFSWKEWAIYKKWMLIECLFKTIKSSDLLTKSIMFLVNNEPMTDDHLDFSHTWPIDGFLED